MWRRKEKGRFTYDSTYAEVESATRRLQYYGEPVDEHDPTSPWLTARPRAISAARKAIGGSDYRGYEGANTGGANAVYWVEVVGKRPDGLPVVRNITEGARVEVDEVTVPIEADRLFPLLRGRDVGRWRARPSAWIVMAQDPGKRRGIDESEMPERTLRYLKQFEGVLRGRAAFKRYFTRRDRGRRVVETGPFYSMFNIGEYTLAPWKVVWREQSSTLTAAVIGCVDGKPVVPDHKLVLVECASADEAHYACALLNSSIARFIVLGFAVEIQLDTHILQRVRVPGYDPSKGVHRGLAELSRRAHDAAARGDAGAINDIEAEVDRQAARLWGLADVELKEIQSSLRELAGGEE